MSREAKIHIASAVLLGLLIPVIQYIGFFWFTRVITTFQIMVVGLPVMYMLSLLIIRATKPQE